MVNDRKRPNSQEPADLGFNPRLQPESPSKKQKFSKSPQSKLAPREDQIVEVNVKTEPGTDYFAEIQGTSGSTPGKTSRIQLQDEPKSADEIPTKKQKRSDSPRQNPFKRPNNASGCTLDSTALLALASLSFGSPFIAPYYVPIPEVPEITPGTNHPRGKVRLLYHEQSRIPNPPLSSRPTIVKFTPFLPAPSQPDDISDMQLLRKAIAISLGSKDGYEEIVSEHEFFPPPSPQPAKASLHLSSCQSNIDRRKVSYNKGYKSIISVEKDEDGDGDEEEEYDDCPVDMDISPLSSISEPGSDGGILLKTGNGTAVPDKSNKFITDPSKDQNATKISDGSNDSKMHTRSPTQFDIRALKRAFASKEAELKLKLATAISQIHEVHGSIESENRYPDQLMGSVENHSELEFTDAPGEDNLHAFIDRAEDDARKAGMPENLVPVKLIVTWDNGAQLNAIQRGIKNLDKDSSVHLIRCSKGWRCAIRQMRNKWFWGNQNWTIWWMEEREDGNKDQRGTMYDTGLSKTTHWCMPANWRTTPSANASLDGQPKVGAGYTRESVAAFYQQRMVIDWPTYQT
ncbi:hypothetical protein EYC80_010729 [Monilinia laxa]|uniref:Uncharacterized protein n=1 Tax=Monilinia laxa TaxID=61186 RepID=A0A5N6JM30_MONLA|nr:hypothetical protein EYC80_010729 [Monilinia laxa]